MAHRSQSEPFFTEKVYTWKHCTNIIKKFRSFFPHNSNYILDFGCGDGTRLIHFMAKHKMPWYAIGIDISPKNIHKALEGTTKKALRQRTDFIVSDVHYIPIRRNALNGAFVINVFHHLKNLSSINELHRVIDKRGILLIIDKPMVNPTMFLGRKMASIFDFTRLAGPGHRHFLFFSSGMLKRALSKGEFEILKERCTCYFPLLYTFIKLLAKPYRTYALKALYHVDRSIEKIPMLNKLGMSVTFLCRCL